MKIKLAILVSLLIAPMQSFADNQQNHGNSSNSKLKVCYNESLNKLYVSGKCKRNAVTLTFEDFTIASFGLIPSGVTVYGAIGGGNQAALAADPVIALASLPSQTSQVFDSEDDIQVANTLAVDNECTSLTCLAAGEASNASRCTGTPENPTAPAGVVCIYPTSSINAASLSGSQIVNTANANSASPATGAVGFRLDWQAIAAGASAVEAVWAYTAP